MADFQWTTNKNSASTKAYTNKPIMSEKQQNVTTYFDCIDIGRFTNFGFLGNGTFDTSFSLFVSSLDNHFKNLDNRISTLESRTN